MADSGRTPSAFAGGFTSSGAHTSSPPASRGRISDRSPLLWRLLSSCRGLFRRLDLPRRPPESRSSGTESTRDQTEFSESSDPESEVLDSVNDDTANDSGEGDLAPSNSRGDVRLSREVRMVRRPWACGGTPSVSLPPGDTTPGQGRADVEDCCPSRGGGPMTGRTWGSVGPNGDGGRLVWQDLGTVGGASRSSSPAASPMVFCRGAGPSSGSVLAVVSGEVTVTVTEGGDDVCNFV